MEYKADDLVLPMLQKHGNIPDPCPVRIVTEDDHVHLYVGPRDWQWDKRTGKLIGTGCML